VEALIYDPSIAPGVALGRMTIGLYNSYDPTKFREAHRRALARVGPLALGFDANLATFGFPFPDELRTPQEVADWVATTTSIGKDGSYLRELAEKGRFQSFPYPGKGFPPQLGEPVLTTCKAEEKKSRSVMGIAADLSAGKSVLLVFGLGPHGVPKKVASIPNVNLDITDGGYSMETCTALGAVVASVAHLVRSNGQ
jgi:hypothetical protein